MSGRRCRNLLTLPLATVFAACAAGTSTTYPAGAVDGELTAYSDSAPSDLLPGGARLMWQAWQHARAEADPNHSDLIVADTLAEEAYTQALLGAEDEAMLLWGEALLLLQSEPPGGEVPEND